MPHAFSLLTFDTVSKFVLFFFSLPDHHKCQTLCLFFEKNNIRQLVVHWKPKSKIKCMNEKIVSPFETLKLDILHSSETYSKSQSSLRDGTSVKTISIFIKKISMNELLTQPAILYFTTDIVSPFHISYPWARIGHKKSKARIGTNAKHICWYMTLSTTVLVSWISTSLPHFSYCHFDRTLHIIHHTCAFMLLCVCVCT